MKKLFTLSLLAVAVLAGANAADYPIKDKPVTIVVPFAAGGPTDRVARDLAEALRKPLGASAVVVENVAGAGGTIGANKVAKAPQDGHTIFLHHIGMAMPMWCKKMVWPSCGALATLLAPMVPPAPATFSTTTALAPSGLRKASAKSRATRSVGPPAAKGTTMVTGLSLMG